MIKLGQYIRINPFTILLFIICWFTGQIKLLLISYSTIFLHEMAHFCAAHFLGLMTDNITFHPFGVNLQLKNKIVFGISDEIILYGAGPVFNILSALVLSMFNIGSDIANYFYTCNIVLFFVNIMPIAPLDGGIIIKKVFTHILGYRLAQNILLCLSVVFIVTIVVIEIIMAYQCGINYSVIIMLVFLFGNIFTQREKYDIDLLHELMFYEKKKSDKGKIIVAYEDADYKKIAGNFTKNNYSIVILVNKDGEITKMLTEKQVIKQLLS